MAHGHQAGNASNLQSVSFFFERSKINHFFSPFDTVIFNAGIMFPKTPRPANEDDLPWMEDTLKVDDSICQSINEF